MTMKRVLTGFLSGIFLLCLMSQAQAIPFTSYANFAGGGTLSGLVDIDQGGAPNRFVTNWILTFSVGTFPDFTYLTRNSVTRVKNLDTTRMEVIPPGISLTWDSTLTRTDSDSLPLLTAGGGRAQKIIGGTDLPLAASLETPVVPTDPGAVLLFGSGLLGLGWWGHRRNLKS